MMNFIIVGAGFTNKGAEAMLFSTCENLIRLNPGAKCYAMIRHCRVKNSIDLPFTIVHFPFYFKLLTCLQAYIIRKVPINYVKNILLQLIGVKEWYHGDAVIDLSGYALTDDFPGAARTILFRTRLAKVLNVPYYFFPQSMGPFRNKKVRRQAKLALANAREIMVRDEESLRNVRELGLERNVELVPDTAFFLEQSPVNEAIEQLNLAGVVECNNLVIVVPNMRVYERFHGDGNNNHYFIMLREVIIHLCQEGKRILLLSHEFRNPANDDTYLVRELFKETEYTGMVHLIIDNHPARLLKAIIGQAQILISSRFHAILAGLSMGVPTIAIGWADKYLELLKTFDLEDYLIDLKQIQLGVFLEKFQSIWSEKEQIKAKLQIVIPEITQQAQKSFLKVTRL